LETQFDEVYDVKQDQSRKEKSSTLMAGLHQVPKKIADVAQAQGVSEKFLANGLPSGVINPSMLAHDRYLSVMDALQDAIIITLLILIYPLLPGGTVTNSTFFIFIIYWLFHIAWWEKTKIWGIKAAANRYIKNTYYFYWGALFLLTLPVATGMWYFIFKLGMQSSAFDVVNFLLSGVSRAEIAIADVFDHIEFIRENLSMKANYSVNPDTSHYEKYFIIGVVAFFVTTIVSKIAFSKLYSKEKQENINFSEEELQFVGETALHKIKQRRNNA